LTFYWKKKNRPYLQNRLNWRFSNFFFQDSTGFPVCWPKFLHTWFLWSTEPDIGPVLSSTGWTYPILITLIYIWLVGCTFRWATKRKMNRVILNHLNPLVLTRMTRRTHFICPFRFWVGWVARFRADAINFSSSTTKYIETVTNHIRNHIHIYPFTHVQLHETTNHVIRVDAQYLTSQ